MDGGGVDPKNVTQPWPLNNASFLAGLTSNHLGIFFPEFIPKHLEVFGKFGVDSPYKNDHSEWPNKQAGSRNWSLNHPLIQLGTWVIFSKALDKSPSSMASAAASKIDRILCWKIRFNLRSWGGFSSPPKKITNTSVMMLFGRKWPFSLGSMLLIENSGSPNVTGELNFVSVLDEQSRWKTMTFRNEKSSFDLT